MNSGLLVSLLRAEGLVKTHHGEGAPAHAAATISSAAMPWAGPGVPCAACRARCSGSVFAPG
ncbi:MULTISPECIES: hypothetical protein [Streptomyces]|uniref:hypothetical protein n=1 Tax=Streptomyces TaxID=1883 RepID=UPI00240E05BD|nr:MULTISPECIES: hypothetical protein [Streptomyces]WFB88544.1 hypothetical protein MMU79_37550 [Streptomyces olivaceus]WGK50685.1 hypothetical protein M6G09_36575 [Streptomyces sp. B146]